MGGISEKSHLRCRGDYVCQDIASEAEDYCAGDDTPGERPLCSVEEVLIGRVDPGSPLDYHLHSLGYTDDEIKDYVKKMDPHHRRDHYRPPSSPLAGRTVGGWGIEAPDFSERRTDKNYTGPAGLALGYIWKEFASLRNQSHRTTHGVHVDVPFVWNKLSLGLVTPSLTVEADLGFPKIEATAGAGPGLHFLFPGLIQLYGKFMVDGHLAQLGDGGQAGWSASATGGIAAGFGLTLYVEGRTAVAGSEELTASKSLHGGLRLFF